MPIRLNCSCGKSLAVKDEFAGKTVKCPGCQKGLKVPAASSPTAKAAAAKPAASPAAAPAMAAQASAAPAGGLDDLFAEEGFAQQTGPVCPSCGKALKSPNAVLCTHCGVNLQTGQRMMSAQQASQASGSLGHYQLDEAVRNMKADAELQDRTSNAGMPWWFLLIMLCFLGGFCFILVTLANAFGAGEVATGLAKTFKDWAATPAVVWSLIIVGLSIQGIARLYITVISFMEDTVEGLVVLFLYYKFLGKIFEYPAVALIYTLGFFTSLSGFGLMGVDYMGG